MSKISCTDKLQVVKLTLDNMIQPNGKIISDDYELRVWAKSNFTYWAKFLAMYYGQKINVPKYKDPSIDDRLMKLHSWTKTEEFQELRSLIIEKKVKTKGKIKISSINFKKTKPKNKKQKLTRQSHPVTNKEVKPSNQKIIYAPIQNIKQAKSDSLEDELLICSNCGGDGGAAGQCYRCGGDGWQRIRR